MRFAKILCWRRQRILEMDTTTPAVGNFIKQSDDNCGKNALEPVFLPPHEKEAEKAPCAQPVPFYQLFRYSTCLEKFLVLLGVALAVVTACGIPLIIILYGEFTTLLVDRAMENGTTTPTPFLGLFGGGRPVTNGSLEDRTAALLEDSEAFGIGATGVGVVQFILGVLCITCLNYTAQIQVCRIRKLFLQAVFRQDMAWCDTNSTSNFASRLTEDLDKLQDGIGEKLGIFVYLLVTFIASVIMSFLHGWKLTLVVLSCAPVIIIATAIVAKVQSSLSALELESYGEAGSVVEEVLSSIRTVVAFGGQDKEVIRYTEKLGPALKTGIKRGLYSGVGGGIMWFIIYCSYTLAFWYGVELILEARDMENKDYTPAVLVIVLFGVLSGAMNMGLASPHLEAFAIARASAAAVFEVISRVPKIDSLSDVGRKPDTISGDIQFMGVHFQYPSRPDVKVLQGLSLTIGRGETVALVGQSGGGKSTVIQLVQRLYDPEQGMVCVDGIDVRQLNVQWLRSHIGVVGQEPVLFGTTIAENIRYGREDSSFQDIEQAAKQANAHEFISKLPQGYDTLVGERGAQLSGGQKQRIAIARALVRQPAILLLDEATSALDVHSEAKVQSALDKASEGRTTIVVAHRLTTIRGADRIIFLSGGQVMEQGSHKELMELKGHYWAQVTADSTFIENEDSGLENNEHKFVSSRLSRQISTLSTTKDKTSMPASELIEEEGYDVPLGRIMAQNKPEWAFILIGCISATLVGCSLPGFAVLFGEVYGVLSLEDPEEVRQQTLVYALMFAVIGVVTGIGTFLQMYMFAIAGVRLTTRLRIAGMGAMLKQEIGWFDDERNSVGALCARLSGDAASVQGATGMRIGTILQSGSTLVIGFLLAMYYSWKMTLVSVISVPLVFGGVFLESRVMHGPGLREKEALEGATKIAVEAISNLRTVASLGGETLFLRRYETELEVAKKAVRRKTRMRGVVFSLGQTAPFFGYALSLYYGGVLVATEGLPYKNVIKVSEALIFGAWMLGQALAFAPNFSAAKLAAGRIFQLVDRVPGIQSTGNKSNWILSKGGIEYDKVRFAYPTRPDVTVLRGLDLLIQPGTTVAVVGPSGCGKSTCIQLLQRLYDPASGNVMVNDADLRDIPLTSLRAHLGLVSQEPVLFDRTIAENIAYGDNSRQVPLSEIMEAAKKANIHTFIVSLPLGYETRMGSRGTQLSGGQKQRVAIARALVRNPRILLLDEATSALDSQSEKVVQAALDQAREGRTCITIAHRLTTVQQADVICVLRHGVIAEMGSHSELVARGGLYCQLLRQANAVANKE